MHYFFSGSIQFGIHSLCLFQVLVDVRKISKGDKLFHLFGIALQLFHKP